MNVSAKNVIIFNNSLLFFLRDMYYFITSLYKVENWKLAENWKIGKYLFQKFFCSTVSKVLFKKFLGLLNGQSFMVIWGLCE